MNHNELLALIQNGIPNQNHDTETWAEFGAGRGNFTAALRDLLGEQAQIIAIDRDISSLHHLERRFVGENLRTQHADFTNTIQLPFLDGILIANALHFVRGKHQAKILKQLVSYLKKGGIFVIVEYELQNYRPWIPHPVPFSRFEALAAEVGLADVGKIGFRQSPSQGDSMYGASARRL